MTKNYMNNNKPLRTMEYSTDNLLKNKPTQDELKAFVNNNIGNNVSMLVEHLLEKEVFSYEDIENLSYFACPSCGGVMKENIDDEFVCESCGLSQTDTPEIEHQEIFEWWMVDDFMAKRLREQGEPIMENDYLTLWGRTCCGQAIYMDSVIETIYKSL